MAIETLNDILEELADKYGAFGTGDYADGLNHEDNCKCRICFIIGLKQRILNAIDIENKLRG